MKYISSFAIVLMVAAGVPKSYKNLVKCYHINPPDDKSIFPPYYAAPVIRMDVLNRHPELQAVLNILSGQINDSTMTELNYRADYMKQLSEKVAKDFLVSKGLWKTTAGNR